MPSITTLIIGGGILGYALKIGLAYIGVTVYTKRRKKAKHLTFLDDTRRQQSKRSD